MQFFRIVSMETLKRISSYKDPLLIGEEILNIVSLHPNKTRSKPLIFLMLLLSASLNILGIAIWILKPIDLKTFVAAMETVAGTFWVQIYNFCVYFHLILNLNASCVSFIL